jgi:hypothetical protein
MRQKTPWMISIEEAPPEVSFFPEISLAIVVLKVYCPFLID